MVALLIRHGHCDAVGEWLAGRQPGMPLTPTGRGQAERLREALTSAPLGAIYSSPLERAMETAQILSAGRAVVVTIDAELIDMDFGDWTGRRLDELATDSEWRAFNANRSVARAPRGESLADVQKRTVASLMRLAATHAGEIIAVVTHAELIRCVLAAFSGATLDEVMSVDISPAHLTVVRVEDGACRVLQVNIPGDQWIR